MTVTGSRAPRCAVMSRSERGGLEDATTLHGAPDAQVLQVLGADLARIVLEHCKIGALAAFDRADLVVEVQRVGGAQRDRAQRVLDRRCARARRARGRSRCGG